jgi:hypothetical protein
MYHIIGMSSSVRWLMTSLNDTVEDRTNDEIEPVPLVPILEDDCNALEDPAFINLLVACGLSEPMEGLVSVKIIHSLLTF